MVRTKVTPRHAEVRPLKCIVYITRNPVTFVIQRNRDLFLLDQQAREKKRNKKWIISSMSTSHLRNLQLLLHPRTLLITDVTRLQPFIAGGDSFRENIETLVSYNVHIDGSQQDCLYIEQGHLMTPTTFMTYSMVIDRRKTVVVTWTPIRMYSTRQQGSQPSSLLGSPLYTCS